MTQTRNLLLICAQITLMFATQMTRADDDMDPGQEVRIRALIELLASKNPAPKRSEGKLSVPKTYDTNAQVVVYLASQQLLAEGIDAFDALVAHFDDDRYSFSYRGVDGDGNMTVGGACHWIMKQTIECYASEIRLITRDQDFVYLFKDSDSDSVLSDWWKKNRTRPLWEVQVEAIEHQIRFMKTVDWMTARDPYLNGGKPEKDEFETLRRENLKILQKMKISIETIKEPVRPKVLHLQRAWMGLLPWQTNQPR